jgi:hypothetical protein
LRELWLWAVERGQMGLMATGETAPAAVRDLQVECLTRSSELSALVDTLLARVRAAQPPPQAGPAIGTPSPTEAAGSVGEGSGSDSVQRVLAEADEWLVGADSLALRRADDADSSAVDSSTTGDTAAADAAPSVTKASSSRETMALEVELVELEKAYAESLADAAKQRSARTALEQELQTVEHSLAEAMADAESQSRARVAAVEQFDALRGGALAQQPGGGVEGGGTEAWEQLWHPNAEAVRCGNGLFVFFFSPFLVEN